MSGTLLDIPAPEYHALDAVSASRLSDLDRSPAYCRWRIDHPHEDTDATRIGDATHAAVLQPDLFRASYVAIPDDAPRLTKAQREAKKPSAETQAAIKWWDDFTRANQGKSVLPLEDFNLCLRLRDAVWHHDEARGLLERCTAFERSARWLDGATDLACKARFDAVAPAAIIDLKTTRSAQPSGFIRSVVQYGYHRQAAWYLRAAAACGLDLSDFAFVVVEKAAPFQVAVYRLDQPALDTGAVECGDLLMEYASCVRSNEWPGYPGGLLSLPRWYSAQASQPEDESGDPQEYPE